ncbi:MAG: dihydroneopterin aldolase [Oscillospiraceae bacterium]|jgi:dihydroneopterin aldolase|nr:dihydroneopterin aldolase [Oscillospiraceae bacterium]
MDKIRIEGLEVFARHGVNPEEQRDGQVFLLDLVLQFDAANARQSDELHSTVNYAQVIKTAAAAFDAQTCRLIERAAQVTAQAVMEAFPAVMRLTLRVHKPDAPIARPVADIVFETTCERDGAQ